MTTELALATVLGLLAGLGIGAALWLSGLRRAEAAAAHGAAQLAGANARLEELGRVAADLVDAEKRANAAQQNLAAARATAEQRENAHEEQKVVLLAAREALRTEFAALAGDALKGSQTQFLEVARETIEQQRKAAVAEAEAASEKSRTAVAQLVQPMAETLKRYEERLGEVEKTRTEAYGGLKEQIEAMRTETLATRCEAAKLANVLRASPKARGRWGELALRNVLERAGLSEHSDFACEVSVEGEDGRQRPDVIIRLPGGRQLIVDAKCAFNAYDDAANALEDNERQTHLRNHAQAMRRHADQLGRKTYWSQFKEAPDFVIMFVPGEHFLSAALETDPELWEKAFESRVLLAGPMHLVGIARSVAQIWRQEGLAQDAAAIGAAARELYDRVATMAEHVKTLGSGLKSSVDNYNKFIGSLESSVLPKARAICAMSIEKPKRELPELGPIEIMVRSTGAPELLSGPRVEAAE